jgi:hypothetical protein
MQPYQTNHAQAEQYACIMSAAATAQCSARKPTPCLRQRHHTPHNQPLSAAVAECYVVESCCDRTVIMLYYVQSTVLPHTHHDAATKMPTSARQQVLLHTHAASAAARSTHSRLFVEHSTCHTSTVVAILGSAPACCPSLPAAQAHCHSCRNIPYAKHGPPLLLHTDGPVHATTQQCALAALLLTCSCQLLTRC